MANRRRGKACIEQRRQGAEYRADERAKRTPQQQIDRLDNLLGKGVGAVKERAKLNKLESGQ